MSPHCLMLWAMYGLIHRGVKFSMHLSFGFIVCGFGGCMGLFSVWVMVVMRVSLPRILTSSTALWSESQMATVFHVPRIWRSTLYRSFGLLM